MSELRAPLEDVLRDPLDAEREARLTRRIEATRRHRAVVPPRRLRSGYIAAAAVVIISLGALLSLSLGRGDQPDDLLGPLRLAGSSARPGTLESPADQGREVTLTDGSRLSLEPGAQVTFERNTGQDVELVLNAGAVTISVRPDGPRRWTVDTELIQVEVVGTRFRLDRSVDTVELEVEEGRVRISGPAAPSAGPVVFGPGGAHVFRRSRSSEMTAETDATQNREEPPAKATIPVPPQESARRATRPAAPHREAWRVLVSERRHAEAFESLGAREHARRTASATTVDELLALADVARLGGHSAQAVAPLDRIVSEHPRDRRAVLAAFTLGRLHTDRLGSPARGAESFRRVLALGAPAALRESAHARIVEASARAGDQAGARRAARDYLERYPDGRWADDVRTWSGLLE